MAIMKKKTYRPVARGKIHILATFNNTVVTIADEQGNTLAQASAGTAGFKGTKKSTPFAATQAVRLAMDKVKPYGLTEAALYVAGVGTGRDAALRALVGSGITITTLRDVTPVPHNGPRAKRPRRV